MKILFLGEENNKLFQLLKENCEDITQISDKINSKFVDDFDFVISYGYRHIIRQSVINKFQNNNIINLHISYLPFNRGADPNLWSILDNTQSGVTIHLVDKGLDTGHILCQKKVQLDFENDTLKTSYDKLQNEIIQLFMDNWDKLKKGKIEPVIQNNDKMTLHYLKYRPNDSILSDGWDTKLYTLRKKYLRQLRLDFVFNINGRIINKNTPTYFIAELSCNHNQDINVAYKLIDEAHKAGADAIKLQTYTADTMTIDSDKSYFRDCLKGSIWEGETLYNLYKRAYTPWEWTKELKEYANNLGMDLFSSPFDVTAVDFLETLNIPCYKIASFEIVDHVLIKRIAQTKKPVIISSGMATRGELEEAVNLLRENGCKQIAMLKCTSAYPAKPEDANLITLQNMAQTFDVIPGLSDHTLGIEVPITAVALGAKIIEKHFTLSRESGSPDDAFSLTPVEFKQMVDSIRIVEKSIGKVTYGTKSESLSKKFRKSLFVVKDIKAGELFTKENVRPIRPSGGLHTKYYEEVLGKITEKDIERGEPLTWNIMC